MIIKKAILHIMDFNSDICVFSQKELDIADAGANTFMDKHFKKIIDDSGKVKGDFLENSITKKMIEEYLNQEMDFTQLSTSIGNLVYNQISKADDLESMDFLFAQFSDETEEYLAMLLLPNKIAYTHQVSSGEGVISNEIIRYYTLLPSLSQKITSYGLVNINSMAVFFSDKKRNIEGETVLVMPEKVLQCTKGISQKDTIKIISKITTEVAEEYGANPAIAVTRAKSTILEKADETLDFSPLELGEQIFHDNKIMKNQFEQKIKEAQLPVEVKVENKSIVRSTRNHKIKTDTGIEITIPTDYFENTEFVEFNNNPNGTISIQLKNIGKIINR